MAVADFPARHEEAGRAGLLGRLGHQHQGQGIGPIEGRQKLDRHFFSFGNSGGFRRYAQYPVGAHERRQVSRTGGKRQGNCTAAHVAENLQLQGGHLLGAEQGGDAGAFQHLEPGHLDAHKLVGVGLWLVALDRGLARAGRDRSGSQARGRCQAGDGVGRSSAG